MSSDVAGSYRYRYDRFGRSKHLRIESSRDLEAALALDPALWVATSMPSRGVCTSERLLAFVDSDGNGRITHCEVSRAISWALSVLADRSAIDEQSDAIRRSALAGAHSDADSIARTLDRIGAPDPVSYRELAALENDLRQRPVTGAGVILPAATEDPTVARCIALAVAVTGGVKHPSGESGLDAASFDRFKAAAREYSAVAVERASLESSDVGSGLDTFRTYRELLTKIDEYFTSCAAAAFTDHAPERSGATLEALPLARIRTDGVLRFDAFVNPAYLMVLDAFRRNILSRYATGAGEEVGPSEVAPIEVSATELSATEWTGIRSRFSRAKRLDRRIDALGAPVVARFDSVEALPELLAESVLTRIDELVATSRQAAVSLEEVGLAVKLALYQRHIIELANNFVSFPDLYDRSARAWFEMGKVVIDGRTLNLAVHVENRPKHVAMAKNASMYVLYLQLRKEREAVLGEIAAPVTSGGRGNLAVGKRGIFVDRTGNELDAEVVEIIENPISITEAITSPVRRLSRTLTGKFETLAGQADQNLQQYVGATVDEFGKPLASVSTGVAPAPPVAQPAAPGSSGIFSSRGGFGGAVFGGSVAIAAVGSALAYITNTLTSMHWWQIVAGLGGAIAAVVIPAVFFAVLKLRRRDLSAVIEASGWAMNTRMRLTRRLQRVFTVTPRYP